MGAIVSALIHHLGNVVQSGYKRDEVALEYISSRIRVVWEPDSNPFLIYSELDEVAEFYGELFDEKCAEESEHYKFLTAGILHKINATKYFHNQGIDSRKLILFSDDCISSIHLLVRPEAIRLNVYMRSSDVMRLLPIDVLALAGIISTVVEEHDLYTCHRSVVLDITIGSAHIVTQDDLEKAKVIVTREL